MVEDLFVEVRLVYLLMAARERDRKRSRIYIHTYAGRKRKGKSSVDFDVLCCAGRCLKLERH